MWNESLQDWARHVHEDILLYMPKKSHFLFSVPNDKNPSLRDTTLKGERLVAGAVFWGSDQQFHHREDVQTYAEPLCRWVQTRRAYPQASHPFSFNAPCKTFDITAIDPANPFELNDVGPNARKYLQSIQRQCTLIGGKCICLPMQNVLILSRDHCLNLFAAFCKVMDKNTRFDVTLKLMAFSKELNEAENSCAITDFLDLLKTNRRNSKIALGQAAYQSYVRLLHHAGAASNRFINELLQNADDCIYPEGVVPSLDIQTSERTVELHYNEVGFTKQNVRAITAIGESTKKQMLSGQPLTEETIGEKGIGFKGVPYRFTVHVHAFRVTDALALQERQQGNRSISPLQDVYCYVPAPGQRKVDCCLYAGLPTGIKLNIPLIIDAPFELTTSRDTVLENRWNAFVRDQVYRAVYGYTDKYRRELLIRSLRFVPAKQQAKTYQNMMFEGNAYLNAVTLADHARDHVFVPTVSGELQQTHLTRKYPAFVRRMIATAMLSVASTALNYSDDEYNAAYTYLGGSAAGTDDVYAVLDTDSLAQLLKEETFRKDLYKYLEDQKGSADKARQLNLVPVWDTRQGMTRYLSLDGNTIYRETGKKQSESREYWGLNELQMSHLQFARIFDATVEQMDHEYAVLMYKRELLARLAPLSADLTYKVLLEECSQTPLLLEALGSMTADEKRRMVLKNVMGQVVDCDETVWN